MPKYGSIDALERAQGGDPSDRGGVTCEPDQHISGDPGGFARRCSKGSVDVVFEVFTNARLAAFSVGGFRSSGFDVLWHNREGWLIATNATNGQEALGNVRSDIGGDLLPA